MNKLLLLRPISRTVHVQKPGRNLNQSFSNTTCRKFTTSIKRTLEKTRAPPAESLSSTLLTKEGMQGQIEQSTEKEKAKHDTIGKK